MKITRNSLIVSLSACILIHASIAAAQNVLYADDFNRVDSFSLGSTSVGSQPWVWVGYNETRIRDQMLFMTGNEGTVAAPRPMATAYVDYNLDLLERYHVTMKLTASKTGTGGSSSGFLILPRTAQATTAVGNRGWVVNCRYYDPKIASGDYTRFSWYDGDELNEFGSMPITRLDTNQFSRTAWQNIHIAVNGDYATLTVTEESGATLVDTNRYIGNYNTGAKSVLLFAQRWSIGRDTEHTLGVYNQTDLDDLEVTTPQLQTVISIR